MNLTTLLAAAVGLAILFYGSSCSPRANPDELDNLGSVDMSIKGRTYRLWIADDLSEHANGLMFVTAERMTPYPDGAHRGMVFIFDHEQFLSFWMRNTIIPLDIVYLDSKGVVVAKHTMAPLDQRIGQYSSGKPAKYAIEVNAGEFADLQPGDRVTIPDAVLKR